MQTVSTPIKKFGAWVSKSHSTVYQAATDGIVCCCSANNYGSITIKSDGSNPPTTIRRDHIAGHSNDRPTIECPVKKDDYWKVELVTMTNVSIFWIPFEP